MVSKETVLVCECLRAAKQKNDKDFGETVYIPSGSHGCSRRSLMTFLSPWHYGNPNETIITLLLSAEFNVTLTKRLSWNLVFKCISRHEQVNDLFSKRMHNLRAGLPKCLQLAGCFTKAELSWINVRTLDLSKCFFI